MAYSTNTALAQLKQTFAWQTVAQSYEPLAGASVDGTNRVYRFYTAPISDVVVYNASSLAVVTDTDYTLNADAGTLVMGTAPSYSLLASYNAVQFSDTQLLDIVNSAFYEFVNRYQQSWYLVDSSGSSFISSSPTTVVDPLIVGTTYFSQSPIQIQAFMGACQYWMKLAEWVFGSGQYYEMRENRSSGLMINKSRLNDALAKNVEFLSKRLDDLLFQAYAQTGNAYGGFVPDLHTATYQLLFAWQPYAEQIVILP